MQKQIVRQLIEAYLTGAADDAAREELLRYVQNDEAIILAVLAEMQEAQTAETASLDSEKMFATLQKILSVDKISQAKTVSLNRTSTKKWWWAAASVVFLVGLAVGIYKMVNVPTTTIETALHKENKIEAPSSNKATIMLADGTTVFLDSINNGAVAQQGNVALIKLANGKIAYQTNDGEIIEKLQYNTLFNPKGSKVIDIALSDGTHVWLNAGSSITYPVVFIGNERKVALKGEGYFEVAKNADMPFSVTSQSTEVQVLGTHFNINAYADDPNERITLLEGSVQVKAARQQEILKPLQQAIINDGGALSIKNHVNIEEVMAWKDGLFYFDEMSLKELMKQIERWYDVEVVFDKNIPNKKFTGKMYKNVPLSEVLKILEELDIHFKTEAKKIIVTN